MNVYQKAKDLEENTKLNRNVRTWLPTDDAIDLAFAWMRDELRSSNVARAWGVTTAESGVVHTLKNALKEGKIEIKKIK